MDALIRVALLCGALTALGANYRTTNFVVTAPTADFAQQVGEAAEHYRRELSLQWTGQEMPRWSAPCPIHVTVGMMGAGGATTFNFERGEVFGWKMNIQGSEERILDSVLPHEINHTIFACYFRRPLPRWADEGAASLIEHESERMRLRKLHDQVMGTTQKIPLRKLLEMKEYQPGQQQTLTLYAEGHSLADYLIGRSGRATYLKLLNDAHQQGWDKALKANYGYARVEALEKEWDQWVMAGSPAPLAPEGQQLADTMANDTVIRGQSPEVPVELGRATAEPPRVPQVASRTPAKSNPAKSFVLSRAKLQQPIAVRPAAKSKVADGTPMNDPSARRALRADTDR